jgi:hypothetical protein
LETLAVIALPTGFCPPAFPPLGCRLTGSRRIVGLVAECRLIRLEPGA